MSYNDHDRRLRRWRTVKALPYQSAASAEFNSVMRNLISDILKLDTRHILSALR